MTNFVRFVVLIVTAFALTSCGDGIAKDGPSDGGPNIFGLKVNWKEPSRRIFVTNASFAGNLNGIAGADAACMSDSAKPLDGHSYKAFLTDSQARVACLTANCAGQGLAEHVDWVLQPNMQYVRPDGTFIGRADSLGLLGFPLLNAISTSSVTAWTGLKDNYTGSIYHCHHFTSAMSAYGNVGSPNSITGQAIDNTFGGCALMSNALYCVEQ